METEIESRLDRVLRATLALNDVPADLSQKNCAAWDSVNHLNLILALEAEFGVTFEPEQFGALRSRAEILALLRSA